MAKAKRTVIETSVINLELSEKEAQAILELLGFGCTNHVIDELDLEDVYRELLSLTQFGGGVVWDRIAHIREE
jgi:hypothetical protein